MLTTTHRGGVPQSHWLPDVEPLLDLTIGDLLRQVATEAPDAVALVDGSAPVSSRGRWTYAELLGIVERVAQALRRRFEVGERVAVWARSSPEWTIVQLAAAMSGVVLVGVDPAFRPAEVEYVLRQSEAAGIIHDDTGRGFVRLDVIKEVQGTLPNLRLVLDMDGDDLWDEGEPVELPQLDPKSTVLFQYTSGTTGFPKGAMLHHLGVINASFFGARRAGFEPGDVWINMLPLAHIAGSVVATLGPIANRGTVVILDGFDPTQVLQTIEEERGTIMLAVPTMLIAMLEDPAFEHTDLASMRAVISGAASVPPELVDSVKARSDCDFSIIYGMTEGPVVLQTHAGDSPRDQVETLGQPQANVELAMVEPASRQIVPCGESGEIWTRAYSVMNGYFRNAEATAEALDADGCHTGNLATMDARGFVQITGRLKDMIIRGGKNLYSREIEELIFTHPSVVDVPSSVSQVTHSVRSSPQWCASVKAKHLDADELYRYCAERLTYAKVPVLWAAVEQYPLTPSGKIRKHVLRDLVTHGKISMTPVASREEAQRFTYGKAERSHEKRWAVFPMGEGRGR